MTYKELSNNIKTIILSYYTFQNWILFSDKITFLCHTGLSLKTNNPNLKSSIICGRIVKTSCCIVVTLIHRYRLIFDSNMMINDTMDGHQSSLRTKINNGWLTFQLCNEKLLITLCLLFVCIFTWFNGKRNFDRLAIFWLVIWLLSLIFTTSVQ